MSLLLSREGSQYAGETAGNFLLRACNFNGSFLNYCSRFSEIVFLGFRAIFIFSITFVDIVYRIIVYYLGSFFSSCCSMVS